jgi:hypothetical protein
MSIYRDGITSCRSLIESLSIYFSMDSNYTQNMQIMTNKGKILCSLLKSSKTTAELAYKIGYIRPDGTIRCNMINRDLQNLTENGYLKSERVKSGKKRENVPTSYSIILHTKNLGNILDEFPYLIENMQSSELALDIIVHEKFSWISNSAEGEYGIENMRLLNKMGKESWKEKLRLSKEFFRFCHSYEYIDMMESVSKLVQLSSEYWETTIFELKTTQTSSIYLWETNYRIEMIFKSCVASDILRGQAKKEAIEYLEQRKNEVLEEQYKQLKEYYSNTKVAPQFLRGKEFTYVENPKIQEIEQEFINNGGKFIQYDI